MIRIAPDLSVAIVLKFSFSSLNRSMAASVSANFFSATACFVVALSTARLRSYSIHDAALAAVASRKSASAILLAASYVLRVSYLRPRASAHRPAYLLAQLSHLVLQHPLIFLQAIYLALSELSGIGCVYGQAGYFGQKTLLERFVAGGNLIQLRPGGTGLLCT